MFRNTNTHEQLQPTLTAGPRQGVYPEPSTAPVPVGVFVHDGAETKYGKSGFTASEGFDMRLETVYPGGATGIFKFEGTQILVVIEGDGRIQQYDTYSRLHKGDIAQCSTEGFQLKADRNTLTVAIIASLGTFDNTLYDSTPEIAFTSKGNVPSVRTRLEPTVGGITGQQQIDVLRQTDRILASQKTRQVITPEDSIPVAENFRGENPQPIKFEE